MNFVQSIFVLGQHAHVGPEFLYEDIDHLPGGGRAGDTDAFGDYVCAYPPLEEEPHHAMELQVLQ